MSTTSKYVFPERKSIESTPKTENDVSTPENQAYFGVSVSKTKVNGQEKWVPKLTLNSNTKYAPFTRLPPMSLGYNSLVQGGYYPKDAMSQDNMSNWSCDARFVVHCDDAFPGKRAATIDAQTSAMAFLKQCQKDLLTHAFTDARVQCSHKKKYTNVDDYIRHANCAIYDAYDQNGSNNFDGEQAPLAKFPCIKTKRHFMYNGFLNTPVFWTMDSDGNFHRMGHVNPVKTSPDDITFIPRGSIVRPRVRLKFYTMGAMYGISASLDSDILVIWMPESKRPTSSIELDVCLMPTRKRQREEAEEDQDGPASPKRQAKHTIHEIVEFSNKVASK